MNKKKDPANAGGTVQGQSTTIPCGLYHTGEGKDNMSEVIERESFTIDTDAKAEWALGKIRAARAERDRMIDWYNAKIKEITEQTEVDTVWLEGMLAAYFRMTEQAHKRTKTTESYSLPSGKLILKKQNPEYKRDDKKAVAWLKANGFAKFVKVKEELDWSSLKDASEAVNGQIVCGKKITEDGEIIPLIVDGVNVIEREEKFVVEV